MQFVDNPPAHPSLPESSNPLKVGWYGLGAMGYSMARNIAASGRAASPILVYNRTAVKTERLVNEIGTSAAIVASSPAQLVTECDIIFTNLTTDQVVQHVYSDFAKTLSVRRIPFSPQSPYMQSISSAVAADRIKDVRRYEHDFPVTSSGNRQTVEQLFSLIVGPPAAADAGQLTVIMSGDYHCKKKATHLLISVGRKIIDLGGNIERAPTLKLVCNGMLMSANELLAEVLTLGEKSGIGAQVVYSLMKEIMPAPSLIVYGDRMLNQHFDGTRGCAIDLGVGVLNDVCRLAVELNCPMPTIDIAHQSLVTARSIHEHRKQTGSNGWDILDCSALIVSRRVSAGLEPFESDVRDDCTGEL